MVKEKMARGQYGKPLNEEEESGVCQRAQWLDHASTVAAAGVGRGDGTTTAAGGQTGSNDVHTQHHRLTKKVE